MWDAETMFSYKQALAAGNSTNVVDVGPGDVGKGTPLYLAVVVGPGASGDLTVTVKTSNAAAMTGAVEIAKYTIPAEKVALGGDVLSAALPTGCKQYLQLAYAGATGGTITAGLTQGQQTE